MDKKSEMPGINEDTIERQEIFCHACNGYVNFNLDLAINGNHVLNCPNCGHEHCRVVRNGKITGERWDQRNGGTYTIYAATYTTQSISTTNYAAYASGGTAAGATTSQVYMYAASAGTGGYY